MKRDEKEPDAETLAKWRDITDRAIAMTKSAMKRDEIANELRKYAADEIADFGKKERKVLTAAADLLAADSALAAENERLREALKPFAALINEIEDCMKANPDLPQDPSGWSKSCEWDDLVRARSALGN